MKNLSSVSKQLPFPFVLEELASIRRRSNGCLASRTFTSGTNFSCHFVIPRSKRERTALALHHNGTHRESGSRVSVLAEATALALKKERLDNLASRLEDFEEYAFQGLRTDPKW